MEITKKLELLTDLFEMDEGDLKPETKLTELESWDSMMKLSLIVFMDDECHKKLNGDTIKGFVTIQDIMNFME